MKKNLKVLSLVLALLTLTALFAACGTSEENPTTSTAGTQTTAASQTPETSTPATSPDESPTESQSASGITQLKLSKAGMTLSVGTSEQLTFTAQPEGVDTSSVVWSSQDPTVATVENGKVTAVSVGTAKIFLKTADGVITAVCTVNVTEGDVKVIPVQGLRLSSSLIIIKKGEEAAISYTVEPENATDKTVQFMVESAAVASIDQTGKVTAVEAGLTKIKGTCGRVTAECLLLVLDAEGKLPASLKGSKTMYIGEKATLTLGTTLYNTLEGLSYTSSDETILKLSGLEATALKTGKATVTVKSAAGDTLYTIDVTVNEKPANLPITGIKLDKSKITVEVGETVKLTATLLPEGAVQNKIYWINESKGELYSVTDDGEITGLKAGSTLVTVYVEDRSSGEKKSFDKVCWIEVVEKGEKPVDVVGISVTQNQYTMKVGETVKVEYSLIPANATNQKVEFILEPGDDGTKTYLSVNRATGEVTALKAGKCYITLYATDGVTKGVYFTITE